MSQRELLQSEIETIAKIGAEGESLVVEGKLDASGAWQFRVNTDEGI